MGVPPQYTGNSFIATLLRRWWFLSIGPLCSLKHLDWTGQVGSSSLEQSVANCGGSGRQKPASSSVGSSD